MPPSILRALPYGPDTDQVADLHRPDTPARATICLLHGGFWRMPYGRDELEPLAAQRVRQGFAVWNIEYRRVGAPGGGWPGTCEDAARAIAHLGTLTTSGPAWPRDRVFVAGHSAGGHLALWAVARLTGTTPCPPPCALSASRPSRRSSTSRKPAGSAWGDRRWPPSWARRRSRPRPPMRKPRPLPGCRCGGPNASLHGRDDDQLPLAYTRAYAQAAARAGDDVTLIEPEGCDPMAPIDPRSAAAGAFFRGLETRCTAERVHP